MKVFCIDCKHYKDYGISDRCYAPGNFVDTYKQPKGQNSNCPETLNRHNTCTMYEVKS